MHQFLGSIGFSKYKKSDDVEQLINEVIANPDHTVIYDREDGTKFAELSTEFSEYMGIAVRGEINEKNQFRMEYYFPYFCGSHMTTKEKIEIERHSDKESFAGVCEDFRTGFTLIFFLQNVIEYFKAVEVLPAGYETRTSLSGLSSYGTIILPIVKETPVKDLGNNNKPKKDRLSLIEAARAGDEEAMESLTLDDIDKYTMIAKRINTEDVLSIVKSSFMPYGIESDQYAIIGEIMDYHFVQNKKTEEEICILTLNCNDMILDVCVNKENMLGEPAIGRRYKGVIWLQGGIY